MLSRLGLVLFWSCSACSCLAVSCLVLSYPVLSCLTLSNPVLLCPVWSGLVSFGFALFVLSGSLVRWFACAGAINVTWLHAVKNSERADLSSVHPFEKHRTVRDEGVHHSMHSRSDWLSEGMAGWVGRREGG